MIISCYFGVAENKIGHAPKCDFSHKRHVLLIAWESDWISLFKMNNRQSRKKGKINVFKL